MWSGPLAATMFSVPPETGDALLPVVAGAACDEDGAAVLEPVVEPPVGLLELDEQAARPPTAITAAVSAAMRLGDLDIGMWHVPLGIQSTCRA
jgi:hypothetical protein